MSCSVCCSDITDFAFGPCNHKDFCAKCMLHWVLLYKETKCPSFKEELTSLVITTNATATFEDTVNNPNTVYDNKLNIYFESQELADVYHARLGLRCPICYREYASKKKTSNPSFKTQKELIKHVTLDHQLTMCDLCLANLKVFPYEMLCFSREEYVKHLRHGITDPNLDYRVDPHTSCRFCHKRFFDDKSLVDHLENSHQHCIFCPPEANAYFNSSKALIHHYETCHYVCDHPSCVGQAFSVFNTRLELMEHKMRAHGERETLMDLFASDSMESSKTEEITEKQIEKARTYLVEDPSGWSADEIRRRNQRLVEELQGVFGHDEAKLERYQKLCGQFLHGTVSCAVFHDLSLNLIGHDHISVFSHLISLVSDPVKRHVLETLFREAKGRKSTQLPREFLESIGAHTCTSTSESPREQDETSQFLRKAQSAGDLTRMKEKQEPAKIEEEPWKSIPYPSSLPISRSLQNQWKQWKWELTVESELGSLLVEKRKVVSYEFLINMAETMIEIVRVLDEVLCNRAKCESWPGVETEKLENLLMVIREQTERQLPSVDWLPMFGVSDRHIQEFELFYDVFKNGTSFVIPNALVINRAKKDLEDIPAGELNLIRVTLAAIVDESVRRLKIVTKDAEEEKKKRMAPLAIPEKAVKEYSLPLKPKKKSVWGTPSETVSFQSLPTNQINSIFPPLPEKKPQRLAGKPIVIKKQKQRPVEPLNYGKIIESPRESRSEEVSPKSETPLSSRFYTPPLSTPAKSSVVEGWGVRDDPVEKAIEKALKESEKKKKGKGNRGVRIVF